MRMLICRLRGHSEENMRVDQCAILCVIQSQGASSNEGAIESLWPECIEMSNVSVRATAIEYPTPWPHKS